MDLLKTWQQANNCLFLRDITTNVDTLENAVYILEITGLGELYLRRLSDKFEFDFKIYGLERKFIDKTIKTYKNTSGNLGVLLNGIKGTGKTVTAEVLSNELNLPVILINTPYNGINTFLAEIPQDICIFIDEYEKVYKGKIGDGGYDEDDNAVATGDSSLLSLMDGTLKTKHRKVFLLTTNKTWINENMLNRPGRLRYVKHFGDLTKEQIVEIVDDCLVAKQFREDVIDFLKPLQIITVDIVKSIISEVNIFEELPEVCCKDFNIEFKNDTYSIVKMPKKEGDKEEVIDTDIPLTSITGFITNLKRNWKGASLYTNNNYFMVVDKPTNLESMTFTVFDANDGDRTKKFDIRLSKEKYTHRSFVI